MGGENMEKLQLSCPLQLVPQEFINILLSSSIGSPK